MTGGETYRLEIASYLAMTVVKSLCEAIPTEDNQLPTNIYLH